MGGRKRPKNTPEKGGRKHPQKRVILTPRRGGGDILNNVNFGGIHRSSFKVSGAFLRSGGSFLGPFSTPTNGPPRDGKPDVRPLKWVFPTPPFRRGVFDKVYSHPWVLAGRCPKLTSAQLLWCTPRLTQWVPVRMYITVHGLAHELEG